MQLVAGEVDVLPFETDKLPHGSIGNLTPVEFARSVRMTGPNEANSSA